jgi:ribosomal protein L37AE/L43A
MRIIKTAEQQHICSRCQSTIAMHPHEIHSVGPPGPYDMDYEPDEIGKKYWYCPVCKAMNYIAGPSDDLDY